jgi:uncharacterized protein (TIGR04255 family)
MFDYKTPKTLKKNEIYESIIEVYFTPNNETDDILEEISSHLKECLKNENISRVKNQARVGIPFDIIKQNEQLKRQHAHQYTLEDENMIILFSEYMFTVIQKQPYTSWSDFKLKAEAIFYELKEFIKTIDRLRMIYFSLAKGTKEECFNFTFEQSPIMSKFGLNSHKQNTSLSYNINDNVSSLQISKLKDKRYTVFTEVYTEKTDNIEFSKKLDELHDISKKTYFAHLKEEYINSLGPTYD